MVCAMDRDQRKKERKEFGTHESDVKPVTGQFKLLGHTLQLCETYIVSASLESRDRECTLTNVSYDIGSDTGQKTVGNVIDVPLSRKEKR